MEAQRLERLRVIVEDLLSHEGVDLVHLESKRQPGGWVLRVYVDKDGGVTLDDCARVSRQLSAQLDVEDPIQHPYTLEVSSPGLDRELYSDQDYWKFSGREIRLTTFAPIDGRRNFQGRLESLADGCVTMTLEGGLAVKIPRDQVAKARLTLDLQSGRHQS